MCFGQTHKSRETDLNIGLAERNLGLTVLASFSVINNLDYSGLKEIADVDEPISVGFDAEFTSRTLRTASFDDCQANEEINKITTVFGNPT